MIMNFKPASCAAVRYLEEAVLELDVVDPDLAGIARNALDMIQNMNHEHISSIDLECLHELLSTVDQEFCQSLSSALSVADPDCPICVLLNGKMGVY